MNVSVLANQSGLRSLALFGLKQPELAIQQALQAGLALGQSVVELNRCLRQLSYPQVKLAIGIHYGPVLLLPLDPQDPQRLSAFGKSVQFATWLESVEDVSQGGNSLRNRAPGCSSRQPCIEPWKGNSCRWSLFR